MNVFVASLCLETNSFSPFPTGLNAYNGRPIYRPEPGDSEKACEDHVGYLAFIQAAEQQGHTVVRGTASNASPGGAMVHSFYESLCGELLMQLEDALPVDMVCLMLHGAQISEGCDDCEGDIVTRVRQLVGWDVPIGVELDLHANLSTTLIEKATVVAACKEYPHTDFPETARQIFTAVEGAAKGALTPTTAWVPIPMLTLLHTTVEPGKGLVAKAREFEQQHDVLSVSIVHGFPWSDTAFTSAGVIVVTDNNPEKAEAMANALATDFFALRSADLNHYLSLDQALDRALSADIDSGPVVIADASDNPGAGTAGDSTFLLRALLERKVDAAAVSAIWDPVAVSVARDAGVGTSLLMRIGGKAGPASGESLDVIATVTALAENVQQRGPGSMKGWPMGDAAAIRVEGIDILLHTERTQTFSPDGLSTLGIAPHDKRVIVVKSAQHFYEHFAKVASEVIYCNAPGGRSVDFASLPYKKLKRPIWPLDEIEFVPQCAITARLGKR